MIAATIMQPDFSSSYGNKHLSDVTLVIYEEPGPDEQSLGTKRAAPAVAEELPGHGVVLIAMSGYCRAAVSIQHALPSLASRAGKCPWLAGAHCHVMQSCSK
jgi:hypothetical protein